MQIGKLYRTNKEEFVANISYRLIGGSTRLWGELVPTEYVSVDDGGDYLVELENSRKIKCDLKKNVNRGVVGIPPRFIYRFTGS